MPKLFCSFRVGLKSAFYGSSMEFAVYFLWAATYNCPRKQIYEKYQAITFIRYLAKIGEKLRMSLRYSWKLFIKVVAVRHNKWKVFQKQTFHSISTIFLLLRCSTEKQTQAIKTTHPISLTFFQISFWILVFCISSNKQKQPPEVFCKKGVLKNFARFTQVLSCEFCESSEGKYILWNFSFLSEYFMKY